MSVLLGDRGRIQRILDAPRASRRNALGRIAGATREVAGVQTTDGMDISLGLVVRRRFQLRLPSDLHRGAAEIRSRRVQLPRDGYPHGARRLGRSCGLWDRLG